MKCGTDLTEQIAQVTAPVETLYCYKHPKVDTVLRCGRCERPICTKCTILGPAGPRCRECAKTNIEFRPAALGLGIKRFFGGIFRTSPWTIWILIVLAGTVFGGVRSCSSMMNPAPPVDSSSESYAD